MTSGKRHPQEANHVVTRQIKNLWWGQSTHEVLWSSVTIAQHEILVLPLLFVMWPHNEMVMWLHGRIPLTLSYHPGKSCGQRSCKRGDIMFLIWHVTSHDHMFRGLCDFIGGNKSFGRRDIMFLICHVTSRDQMIRWFCNFMSGFPSSTGEVTSLHVLCQFQLKINNTYNNQRHVFLTNWLKMQHHFLENTKVLTKNVVSRN